MFTAMLFCLAWTGVSVEPGDIVYITPNPLSAWTIDTSDIVYVSNARGHTDTNLWCTPCGCASGLSETRVPNVTSKPEGISLGTLVYKVKVEPDASKGIWQAVGTHTEFAAENAGNVYLAHWDTDSLNNDGCIEVRTTRLLPPDCNF